MENNMAYKPNYPMTPEQLRETQIQAGIITPGNPAEKPAGDFAAAGNRFMSVTPSATFTNFPTSRDVVNQSVQRALTTRAAVQPPAPAVSPYLDTRQNAVATQRKQTEDQLLAWKDRSQWTVEWKSHGIGETPVVRRLTPQEQQQNWQDQNTMISADINGKSGPALNVFGGGNHLDTPLLTQSRKDINPTVWANYRQLTRQADEKLNQALASRANVPHSIEEAQQFVDSLGFDDRVGEHVDRAMTRYMQNANPELYKQIIGQKDVQRADDASYVQWAKRYATIPGIARLSPEEILGQRTPESQHAFEMDPHAVRHGIDPATGKVIQLDPRELSSEEKAQEKFKQEQTERNLQNQQIDEIVARSGGRMVKTIKPDGQPTAIPIEQYQKEQDKLERENIKEDREATREMRDQAAEQRRAAADTPEEKRRQKLEDMATKRRDRLEEIAYKAFQTNIEKLGEEPAAKQYETEMTRIKKIAPVPGEDVVPAPAVPVANEPTATNAQGQKMVYRNGQWIAL
jgi:hypothetical protein